VEVNRLRRLHWLVDLCDEATVRDTCFVSNVPTIWMAGGKPIGLSFLEGDEFCSFNKGRDVTYHKRITRDVSEFTIQSFRFYAFLRRYHLASGDICET
jgi:hypothetical protein